MRVLILSDRPDLTEDMVEDAYQKSGFEITQLNCAAAESGKPCNGVILDWGITWNIKDIYKFILYWHKWGREAPFKRNFDMLMHSDAVILIPKKGSEYKQVRELSKNRKLPTYTYLGDEI